MSYTAFSYIFFVIALVIFYYIVRPKYRWYVLLFGNLVFYYMAGWDNLVFLVLSLVISYFVAIRIDKLQGEFLDIKKRGAYDRKELKIIKEKYNKRKHRFLTFGLGSIIVVLVILKYANFILGNVHNILDLFGISNKKIVLNLVVPMGISFYTFQMIAYLMDVYNGEKAQKNFLKYALYSSFFPSVVQGPIPRYHDLGKQLEEEHVFNMNNITSGIMLILWGYIKKLVIAERLALFVDTIYNDYSSYEGIILMIATVVFSIQIYTDFAGCMDIVTGTARLFGIYLKPNFIRPYFSKTMPEFWRRWHVTLGAWFKDYVFYPFSISNVSLKLNKKARKKFGNGVGRIVAASMPILVVWSLTGIWHGAEWKYVIWGLFHGVLIILSTIFAPYNEKLTKKLNINKEKKGFQVFQILRTFTLCCIGRVFFRADNFKAAIGIFKQTFSGLGLKYISKNRLFDYGLNAKNMLLVTLFCILIFIVSVIEEKSKDKFIVDIINEKPQIVRYAILYILIFSVILFGSYGPGYNAANFIYEQF